MDKWAAKLCETDPDMKVKDLIHEVGFFLSRLISEAADHMFIDRVMFVYLGPHASLHDNLPLHGLLARW